MALEFIINIVRAGKHSRLFTLEEESQLISDHYSWFWAQYSRLPLEVRASVGRYFVLHRYGGVWLASGVAPLRTLDTVLLPDGHAVLGYQVLPRKQLSDPAAVWDGFIAAPARHPFLNFVINRLEEGAHNADLADDPVGAAFITRCARLFELSDQEGADTLTVHPMPTVALVHQQYPFRRIDRIRKQLCDTNLEKCQKEFPDTYLTQSAQLSRAELKCHQNK